jgi:hypothetical protein
MKTTSIFLLTLSSFFFVQTLSDNYLSKEFYEWNKKTLESITKHKTLAENPKVKELWSKKYNSLKNILYSAGYKNHKKSIEDTPSRYKFLKMLQRLNYNSKHFFIVETQINGRI